MPWFCTVTVAFGTSAPVASVTVPPMVAVVDNCARITGLNAQKNDRITKPTQKEKATEAMEKRR